MTHGVGVGLPVWWFRVTYFDRTTYERMHYTPPAPGRAAGPWSIIEGGTTETWPDAVRMAVGLARQHGCLFYVRRVFPENYGAWPSLVRSRWLVRNVL